MSRFEDTGIARVTCTHDCPDGCAMLVTVRDGRAVDVAPNPTHPVTGRHLCVKVVAMQRARGASRMRSTRLSIAGKEPCENHGTMVVCHSPRRTRGNSASG